MYDIGEMANIRQTTFLKDSGNDFQSSKNSKIHYVLVFDGNSIGKIFIEKLKDGNEPKWDNEELKSGQITTREIMNINETFEWLYWNWMKGSHQSKMKRKGKSTVGH